MKIVLTQPVEGLGRKGELHDVKPGYARNYLLVKSLAVLASDQAAKSLQKEAEAIREKEEVKEQESARLAQEVSGKTLTIKAKVGEKNQLFAGIGAEDIKKAVKEQFDIEAEKVNTETLKTLGEHDVVLQFGHGSEAVLTVIIEPEEAKTSKTKGKKS